MHTLGVEIFAIGQLKQRQQNIATDLRRTRLPRNTKMISTAGNFDVKTAFDLPQVFIKLTAQVRQAVVIGGLED